MPTFIPEITQAYQNDPRTLLANRLAQQGSSTAPVAAGKYGWADGIARALTGVAAAYAQKRQEKKYENREQSLTDAVANALGNGNSGPLGIGGDAAAPGGGEGVVPPQGVQQPSGGMPAAQGQPPAPAMVPPPQNNPAPVAPPMPPQIAQQPQGGPQGIPAPPPPQAPPMAAPAPPMAPQIAAALAGQQAGPVEGSRGVPFASPRVQGAQLIQAMIPITAATESRSRDFGTNGKAVTSPKGAKYAMQVMPATARQPGFGIAPAANDSPAEYDRVGKELIGKLTEKYGGDPAKAWAAYNGGTGRVDHALAKHGEDWLSHMPAETQAYVQKTVGALGGTGGDGRLPGTEQQKPLEPTGPTQYQTAEPQLPDMPTRPQDRTAVQSRRLTAGQKLLQTRDPALFERAMAMLDTGMGEQFNSDREALAEANRRDDTGYEAGLNDAYSARSQKRLAAYDQRGREQTEGYAYGREMRGYNHEDNTLGRTQAFNHNERIGEQQYQSGENALNRQSQRDLTQMTIEGKHEDAATKAQGKMQNFLSTPAGSRMYQTATETMNAHDNINNQIDQFMALNEKEGTGGMLMNMPTGAGEWFARNLNSNLQQMDAITHTIAPLMRQAGQGSMSDRDLQMFERSVPNIRATREANIGSAQRMKLGVQRMNDFELHKLQAAAEGKQVDFLREWTQYKAHVPFMRGISFDDWKASLPQFDAQGNRK